MSRVLVTGIGAVTSAGTGREALWNALCDGGAPATSSTPVAPPGLPAADPVLLAPMATPPAQEYLGRRGIRVLSPESKAFAIAAVAACRDAGLPTRWECEPTVGVAAGTTTAGLADYVELLATRLDLGVERVNPAQGPQTGLNAPAATASIFTGAGGPNLTLSTGRAASADALAASARAVHAGEATVMLAGGVQTLTYPEVYARRGVDPRFGTVDRARPLDRERAGAVPGEAAVVLALESADAAARRRAVVLAEVVGTGAAMGPATGGAPSRGRAGGGGRHRGGHGPGHRRGLGQRRPPCRGPGPGRRRRHT
ncbi:hypothetical protein AQ490_17880 [Wenjunlia vitaminophila]|uniref:Ketosynthase family 3 (KS3) domain-containing protein n=1 Tax=Wenjunlia vitaminophila TaxID=76728 RepID=A0A0T6LUZ6_WENVI|nr:beta-ketoacyl synthase N-terminal-like domain-containing protein [Wenjunlia vitaminophila]KRV49933.1 hypothetical protein AQ490_17880 [Wenjunlia vitaminophila]